MSSRSIPTLALIFALACVLLCHCGEPKAEDDGVTRIAFIAAAPSHGEGEHEWDQDAQYVRDCILQADNINQMVKIDIYDNGWPKNSSDLDNADAIVFFTDGRKMHTLTDKKRLEKIDQLAKKGVGLAFLHYSIDPPEGAESYFLDWIGGCYEKGKSQNPINTVEVQPVDNGHPITRGCGGYIAPDEWYFDLGFRETGVTPLMTGKLPPRDPKDKVLAWAFEREDGGRGFGFSGGHYHKNWHMEPFRKLVINAILWTAKMEVPEGGVSTVKPWKFVSIPNLPGIDLASAEPGWSKAVDQVLEAIKSEKPEFVLVPGNLIGGDWSQKEEIKEKGEANYSAWVEKMNEHGLKYYAAMGVNEIGGDPAKTDKADLMYTFGKQFQKHLGMPLNGPLRMRGTAYWKLYENVLLVAPNVFERPSEPNDPVVAKVSGDQLEWFRETLEAVNGAEHVIVMASEPVLGADGVEGGTDSEFFKAMQEAGTDLYLCGTTGELACKRDGDLVQISHGGLLRPGSKVSYLVGKVSEGKIALDLKQIEVGAEGDMPVIGDGVKKAVWSGKDSAVIDKTGETTRVANAVGCFDAVKD